MSDAHTDSLMLKWMDQQVAMAAAAAKRDFPLEFSESIAAIAGALAAAQGEIQDAKKDAVNPHFKNKYSTLSSIRTAITPAFSKNSLAVSQYFEPHGVDGVMVITLLMHKSGEWIKSKLFVPVAKKDAQGMGSAISYGRRYQLAAIANIASDDDDDANPAAGKATPEAAKSAPAAKSDVDVPALILALESATNAKELSEAALAVGRVASKLAEADRVKCRAAHDNKMRELDSQDQAAQ